MIPSLSHRPVIAVVGSGAVGCFYGGRLAQAGHEVHFLLRSDYDAIRQNGLHIRSFEGDFTLSPDVLHIYRDPHDMPKADLVLVTLKATGNAAFESLIRPLMGTDTTLLTLQNGLGNEDELARLFGPDPVTGGMAFVCINRTAPGMIHHIDHGFLKIGEFAARGVPARGKTQRMERIADLFRSAKIECHVLENLRRGRWEKLIWNIPFNGLGAVLDLATDRLIGFEAGIALITRLMQEVKAIAAADGIDLPGDIIAQQIRHTRTMGAYQSSMQIDRQQGREMEIEAILGEPLRLAAEAGVATPTLHALYDMGRLIGSGKFEARNSNDE